MIDARSLLADVLRTELPPLDEATPLATLRGLDSLGMVNLVLKVEGTINRELTESELEGLTTVGAVAALLRAR